MEVFEFYGLHLLARKKLKEALKLSPIKSSLYIGKTAGFNRRRAGNASFLFANRIEEIQRLAASVSLHVPMCKGAVDRIPQKDEKFDLRIVITDPFRCRLVIKITGRAVACDHRRRKRRIMFVQLLVIDSGDE